MEAKVTASGFQNITRLGGADRYATSLAVAQYFNLSGQSVCIATSNNFPDALAGSVYNAIRKDFAREKSPAVNFSLRFNY